LFIFFKQKFLAAGVGFACMHVLMFSGSLLTHIIGPGALFVPQCTQFSVFLSSGKKSTKLYNMYKNKFKLS
jgi:hypothetical protein